MYETHCRCNRFKARVIFKLKIRIVIMRVIVEEVLLLMNEEVRVKIKLSNLIFVRIT